MSTTATTTRPAIANTFQPFFGNNGPIAALEADIHAAARSDAKVLITGETGAGKEVVATMVHERSRRRERPFITINCAGVPETLLESTFFGHARGSFTNAYRDSPGLLRQAHGGTVFLDEVGEMSPRMQALLLRFLETGELQMVGGSATRADLHADVRVITATNRDLAAAVAARDFREDLFYRLNVLHLRIPPLRDRKDDIVTLVRHYVRFFAQEHGLDPPRLAPAVLDAMLKYAWPGNVRELKNVVERLVLRCTDGQIEPHHLPVEIVSATVSAAPDSSHASLSHVNRIERLLERMLDEQESFWTGVYPAFMARDITRDDLRHIIHHGLDRTRGSYRMLLALFNMDPGDYKRFLCFLRQHECQLPFQRFRMLSAGLRADRRCSSLSSAG
jgi:DNA-binding NtrC family response regulator